MFGQNPIRPLEQHRAGDQLRVQEIFYTLQGEGPYTGVPCVFIRLAGCNLRCHFCDTQFDSGYDNQLSLAHIIKAVDFEVGSDAHFKRKLVVISGGEPMIQNILPLIQTLLATGTKVVQIETAGTTWVDGLEEYIDNGKVVLVCSPKTPKVHPKIAQYCVQWKYVVEHNRVSLHDGLPSYSTQTNGSAAQVYRPVTTPVTTIWVSPCDAHEPEKNIQNMVTARDAALQFGYRLNLQVHKIVNVA